MIRNRIGALVCMVAVLMAWAPGAGQSQTAGARPAPVPVKVTEKWVYLSGKASGDDQWDKTQALIERIGKAGYTTAFLYDGAAFRPDIVSNKVSQERVQRLIKACREQNLKVVMCGSANVLGYDPNLGEGMPVVEAPFVVKDGKVVPGALEMELRNPSFETAGKDGVPEGWFMEFAPKAFAVDNQGAFDGKTCIRMADIKGVVSEDACVITQTIKVKKHRYYHMTAQIKTKDFENPGSVMFGPTVGPPGDRYGLNHNIFQVAETQDWKKYEIIFDTMDREEIDLHLGAWGAGKGTIWFDDLRIEPGGLVNLLRRESAPLMVRSEDGTITYEEGKDFTAVRDPKTGRPGSWGSLDLWHEQPVVKLVEGGRIKEGQTLRMSYYHAVLVYDWSIMHCMNEPKTREIAAQQIHNVHTLFDPDGYFMPYDEIRFQGWDLSCQRSNKTPGQTLAEDVAFQTAAIRKEDPGKPIYVWNDMFDPNHNAGKTKHYYLVKGNDPWWGSWEGLDRDVIIMNWMSNAPARRKSLEFFAGRGHKQILAGFYDAPIENIVPWLEDASHVEGVQGVMYTTWADDFSKLEAWMGKVMEASAK